MTANGEMSPEFVALCTPATTDEVLEGVRRAVTVDDVLEIIMPPRGRRFGLLGGS